MVSRRPKRTDQRRRSGGENRIRIIGGEFRGRRLSFPDLPGLRPTGDRIRETLFNWLQPMLPGASCLDLFSGSGALGLEAASRGAGSVVLLEKSPRVVNQLRQNCELLGASGVEVIETDTLHWLGAGARPFDLVFVDPPFTDEMIEPCCRLLEERGWLAERARIYLEMADDTRAPKLPDRWQCLKEKRAGDVAYFLYSC